MTGDQPVLRSISKETSEGDDGREASEVDEEVGGIEKASVKSER